MADLTPETVRLRAQCIQALVRLEAAVRSRVLGCTVPGVLRGVLALLERAAREVES